MCRVCDEKDIRGLKDPRLPIYLAMVWRHFPETLQASRARDRIAMSLAASLGRVLRMKLV